MEPKPHYAGLSDEPRLEFHEHMAVIRAELLRLKPRAQPQSYSLAGLAQWISDVIAWDDKWHEFSVAVFQEVQALTAKVQTMATTIDQLQSDFDKYKGDVSTALATLQASVAALQTELANAPVSPAVQAKMDALDADMQAADAVVNPPKPTT